MSIIAIIYTSLTTLTTNRFKKNYSLFFSGAYEFCNFRIFSLNIQGIEGSIILMLSHGLVSSPVNSAGGTSGGVV